MSNTILSAPATAPAWTLLGFEPLRAALEYANMRFMEKAEHPPGDGHPVVIFPGLAADRHSTTPLKNFCERLGYTVYDLGRGFNTGPQASIFSRSDGIVAWQSCIQDGDGERTENIEVDGSHCRLGWNAEVLSVIADRLRPSSGAWQPYAPTQHKGAKR